MSNVIDSYIHVKYAEQAFTALMKALGMANTVHRGYTKAPQDRGNTIQIDVPSSFEAQAMPAASDNDIVTSKIDLVLNQWKGVQFAVRDDELSFASERLIRDSIIPAGYAVADAIDQSLQALYADVPWFRAKQGTDAPVADIIACREILFDNKVPMNDMRRFLQVDGEREAAFLNQALFNQNNTGADGGATQREGFLGRKFGFNVFANQNVTTHAAGSASATALLLNANAAKGATTIVVKHTSGTLTGDVHKGDTLVIAGNTQRYAVAADASASGNLITITLVQPLAQAYSADDAVTLRQSSTVMNMAYHETAFALGFAPLVESNGLGTQSFTIQDPVTGLSLRTEVWRNGATKKTLMSFDALWGVKTLDGNRAVRYES